MPTGEKMKKETVKIFENLNPSIPEAQSASLLPSRNLPFSCRHWGFLGISNSVPVLFSSEAGPDSCVLNQFFQV